MSRSITEIFKNVGDGGEFCDLSRQVVEKINIKLEERFAKVVIRCIELIDRKKLDLFSTKVKVSYNLKNFLISLKYEKSMFGNEYFSSVIDFFCLKYPLLKVYFANSKIKIVGLDVKVEVGESAEEFFRKNSIEKEIKQLVFDEIGVEISLDIEYISISSDEILKLRSLSASSRKLDVKQNLTVEEKVAKPKNSNILVDSVIYGRKIKKNNVTKIRDVINVDTEYVIEGKVFTIELREMREEKVMFAFYINDDTYSIVCKIIDKKNDNFCKLYSGIKVRVRGKAVNDKYMGEINIMVRDVEVIGNVETRCDDSKEKRVELHAHTTMSAMDGMTPVKDLVECAARFGHKAIAVTDHGSVQAFPEAHAAGEKHGVKIIYGMEGYLVDDSSSSAQYDFSEKQVFIVFDIETTGLRPVSDAITEIGAVKIRNGEVIEAFSELINPGRSIPTKIVELTGITDDMIKNKPKINEVLPRFLEFCGEGIVVAHNANFDVGFIKEKSKNFGLQFGNKVLDTLAMARCLLPFLKKYKLNILAEHLGVPLLNHHRAVDDAVCTMHVFLKLLEIAKKKVSH